MYRRVINAVAATGTQACAALASGLVLASVAAPAAHAAAPEERDETHFEVTPFIGQMAGGEFEDPTTGSDRDVDNGTDWGVFLNLNAGGVRERQYEMFYAQQGTTVQGAQPFDMDVSYLHFGGIVNFTDVEPVIPYFGITIGATQLSPDAAGLDDETKFSISIGGGLKYKFTKHIGVRLDLRTFVTLLDTDGNIFCVSTPTTGGTCAITAKSDSFIQYAAGLGFIGAF